MGQWGEKLAKKVNPRELLDQVLGLIQQDVEEISKIEGQFEGEVAATLVRYSDALLKITRDKDSQDDAEREKLANLSTAELKEKARRFAKDGI